jgi:hypothetical protein
VVMDRPLALTDDQREIVVAAANGVPVRWRERFLNAVSDILTDNPAPTNSAVIQACGAARRAITVGIGPVNMR